MRYEDVPWEAAACKGIWTDLFYMENQAEAPVITPTLRRMCAGCPILDECREYAVEHERWGFWAGMTMSDRAQFRKKMRGGYRAA